jgi:hypothetical protein
MCGAGGGLRPGRAHQGLCLGGTAHGVAERGVEAFRTIAPDFVRIVGRMPARAEFEGAAGPCRVWFQSADNPDSHSEA